MEKDIEKDCPLVSIVLAIYNPNINWLIKQLTSLNEQSYNNLELLISDDCSTENIVDEQFFAKYITKFPFKFKKNEFNIGSNLTFQELTVMSNGKYISYCDQDDIWLENKIELMVQKIETTGAVLVCSDLFVIDENDKLLANTICSIRKRHVFREGKNLAKYLISSNFVTGCASMVRLDIAKKAIPFNQHFVHDQWLALVSSIYGEIVVIREPLVYYRQHSSNQTGVLTGVFDKESYRELKIDDFLKKANSLKDDLKIFNVDCELNELFLYIEAYKKWLVARKNYFYKPTLSDLKIIIKYKHFGNHIVMLESVLGIIPTPIFKILVKLAKRGIL